mmetsp:Transcript_49799/g.118055  ORF Transcript_49799/g.118055 Transcript_49799/m.118055 type:complete len:94 (-) Transcript_49799:240-521(-)
MLPSSSSSILEHSLTGSRSAAGASLDALATRPSASTLLPPSHPPSNSPLSAPHPARRPADACACTEEEAAEEEEERRPVAGTRKLSGRVPCML